MSYEGDGIPRPDQALPAAATAMVTVTVIAHGTGYRTTVQVPADLPAGNLVGELGGPVGVPEVANLLLGDGTPIPADATLARMGVTDGAAVYVVGVYDVPTLPETSETSVVPVLPAAGFGWPAPITPEEPAPLTPDETAAITPEELATSADVPSSDAPTIVVPDTGSPGVSAANDEPPTTVEAAYPGSGDDPEAGGDEPAAVLFDGAADMPTAVVAPVSDIPPAPPPPPPDATPPTNRSNRKRWILAAVAVAVVVVLVGAGLLIGRNTSSKKNTSSPLSLAAARSAVQTWLAASAYPAATVVAGSAPGRGREGKLFGTFQVVGSLTSGSQTDVWFVVVPTGKSAVGLTVQLEGGKLAGAPSVSALPFGGGQLPPVVTQTQVIPHPIPAPVVTWASDTFGPSGALTSALGIGEDTVPAVIFAWSPPGGGSVLRVAVGLGTSAPGTQATAASAALAREETVVGADTTAVNKDQATVATAQAAATKDQTALSSDQAAVTKDAAAITADNAAVATDTTANTTAAQALAQVTAAANAANAANAAAAATPPTPPATAAPATAVPDVGSDQAAATAAAQTLAAAQAQLTKDQAQQTTDQAQQTKDQAQATKDKAQVTSDQAVLTAGQAKLARANRERAKDQARVPQAVTAVGTYDVWLVGGRVKGWVPAGYQGR